MNSDTLALHRTWVVGRGCHNELATYPSESQAPCRTSRICTFPEGYGFLISEQNDILLIKDDEPTTYEEYMNSLKSDKWFIAMKSKMDSTYTNQVWTSVDPPKGIKAIGSKWIFKKKTNMEGNVITYKARFMV